MSKSILEIAQAINDIGIPDLPKNKKLAMQMAKDVLEEYTNALINEDEVNLKYFIESAIFDALEVSKEDILKATLFGYHNCNNECFDPEDYYNDNF